ncbi:secretion protein HlyD [Ciceribacter thiooxidans]|uniref:Secretion protein HlyD n=1 Tax=Ciceribacter thiooxidans TaxID=1969821 RepID=A0ABV7I5P2_9HYPH|nr:secretion protein HlyD [Ciceribacter thiooxidans]
MKKTVAVPALLLVVSAGLAAAFWTDLPTRFGWESTKANDLTLYGNVDIRQVQLGFRVSGRIAGMKVEEGDAVHQGQTLATLDAGPYEDSMHAAEAQVAALKATLDKLIAGPRPAEIEQARAVHEERTAELQLAQQAFDRARQLRPSDAISQADLDQAAANRAAATARLASARESLRLLEEGSRPEDIAVARANLEAAEASFAGARTALADTELKAPADAIVLSRVREPGAIISPSDTVYVLSLAQPVWIRTYIAEPMLGLIHPGMQVEVHSDSAPGKPYRGRIGFISPVAEFTPKSVETPELRTDLVYRLRVIVDNADPGLRQGMPVTVRIPATGQTE